METRRETAILCGLRMHDKTDCGSTLELNVFSEESRTGLARMTTRLFKLWSLSPADQLNLLGMQARCRYRLSRYRHGKAALPENRDTIDRVGWLMSIHESLGILYPHNPEIKYGWVNCRNKRFDNLTPLEVMREQGLIGIAKVAKYLDCYREM